MTESRSLKGPKHLPGKLLTIRHRLEASPSQMATLLDHAVSNQEVGEYEAGISEPDWLILLRYAKLARISMDVLIDDRLELTFPRNWEPPNKYEFERLDRRETQRIAEKSKMITTE